MMNLLLDWSFFVVTRESRFVRVQQYSWVELSKKLFTHCTKTVLKSSLLVILISKNRPMNRNMASLTSHLLIFRNNRWKVINGSSLLRHENAREFNLIFVNFYYFQNYDYSQDYSCFSWTIWTLFLFFLINYLSDQLFSWLFLENSRFVSSFLLLVCFFVFWFYSCICK